MGLFHAPLFLAIVSGVVSRPADQPTDNVTGYLNEDVILPCNCSNTSLEEGFKWQFESEKLVFHMNATAVDQAYKSRVEAFQENDNCSIRLKSLTANDSGTYLCTFYHEGLKRHLVYLRVEQQPTVAHRRENTPEPPQHPKHPRQNFIIFPIIVLLLVVGCLWKLYQKQRRNRSAQNQDVTEVPEDV